MLGKFKKGWVALACSLLMALVLGVALPALAAEGDDNRAALREAQLVKVISAPRSDQVVEADKDRYTFKFTVAETQEDGVSNSEVPAIDDLILRGVEMTGTDSSNVTDGLMQSVVAAKLSYILGMSNDDLPYEDASARALVKFPHAGVYTYIVTEADTDTAGSGFVCLDSAASYKLRILVSNDNSAYDITGQDADAGKLVADMVTVEELTDDYGNPGDGKINPSNPEIYNGQKIVNKDLSAENPNDPATYKVAGDPSGINVDGFTFGNRYIKGGDFVIEKKVEGTYGDKTKYFDYTLTITDSRAQIDAAVTYDISGGKISDETPDDGIIEYADAAGRARCFTWKAGEDGNVNPVLTIKFTLRDGGKFTITGLWGFPITVQNESGEQVLQRENLAQGLNSGTMFTVDEKAAEYYTASAVVYGNESATYGSDGGNAHPAVGENKDFSFTDYSGVDGTHVYVVNTFDDDSISFTGIFIDNLPYIVMIAAPLAVFAVMFARRRRANAAA